MNKKYYFVILLFFLPAILQAQWSVNGDSSIYYKKNIAIGTDTAAYPLTINGDINLNALKKLRVNKIAFISIDSLKGNLFTGIAGLLNTTGTFNTATGDSSLFKNKTGS
jgi:hypothetical protein